MRHFDRGEGPVLLFVHGVLANANLWRKPTPSTGSIRVPNT
jgi:hypothetical protein